MRLPGKKLVISLGALVMTSIVAFSGPVLAAPGLLVEPIVLGGNVLPGDSRTFTLTVSSAPDANPMDMVVEVMGVGQSLDGGYRELTEDEDTSPYSARSLISISPQEFRLAPGSSQDIEVIVAVPSDIGSGGRYAIIYTHNEPADQSGTSIVSAVGSSVVLTLTDTELTKDGSITNLDFGEPGSGEPLDVTVIFQNTGNYHYKARAEVSLSDAQGNVLAKTSSPLCASSIIPGYSRQFTVSLAPEQALSEGEYYVESSVVLEDGTLLDTTEIKLDDGDIQGTVQGIDVEGTETDTTRIIAIITGATVAAVLLVYFLVIRKRRATNR